MKEELETINNWLKEEYGISYTELNEEIKRLKENYMILQNASDERENELIAESTKWESKFYDEAKKVDKAIECIDWVWNNTNKSTNTIVALRTLENILKGSE